MTTIAYRDGVMASDTAVTLGDTLVGGIQKIFSVNGHIIGASGGREAIVPLLKWIEDGMDAANMPTFPADDDAGFYAIIVDRAEPEKICYYWTTKKGTVIVDPIEAEYFAVGSGKFLAMGAMAHGAGAQGAVRAAIKHDPHSAGPMNIMHVSDGLLEKST